MADARGAEHFQDLEQQAHAARLGMWVFLASELLLFAGLFALYAAYRLVYPETFAAAVQRNPRSLGSLNTAILLTSSYAVAWANVRTREGHNGRAVGAILGAMALGVVFLGVKFTEYAGHFHEGIFPGGRGAFFQVHAAGGWASFYTLYYAMTGLHALHVVVGLLVLAWMVVLLLRGGAGARKHHPVQVGAMYWHFVDLVWIFLWPMFYLMHGA